MKRQEKLIERDERRLAYAKQKAREAATVLLLLTTNDDEADQLREELSKYLARTETK